MTREVTVTFLDPARNLPLARATVPRGTTVLEAALAAGVEIEASCGRRGRCRACRVRVVSGEIAPPTVQDTVQLGHDGVRDRLRLSCQMPAVADCAVAASPERGESGHQILGGSDALAARTMALDSGVLKRRIAVQVPQDENQRTSDVEQLLAALPAGVAREVPMEVYRKLPAALRENLGEVTVTTFADRVIDVEPGDTTAHRYGMAFDIGTTTIVATLHDLGTGEQLAACGGLNAQAVFGGDLMSRIAFAQFDRRKLQELRGRVLSQVNELVAQAVAEAGVRPEHLCKIVVVGNTCMHHLFLGIDTSYLGLAPYAAVLRDPLVVPAADIPLKGAPNARICFLPIVAGFVGADTVAGVAATRIDEREGWRLLVDIGTNGEVVLASRERVLACSAPAGPTFEGGQVRHGMRSAAGAIEQVQIDDEVACQTIGDAPAIGICGSGLIDAVAAMLEAGVLNPAGRLWRPGAGSPPQSLQARIVEDPQRAFVLVRAAEGGRGEDIVLTQNDIRQLQLAKAAILGGIRMLQQVSGVPDAQIEELLLAGGFGNYVKVASAVRIGLLPQIPLERIRYVGNAALLGAQLALLSETERTRAVAVAQRIEHVALATHPGFQEIFVAACRLGAA